MASPHSVFFLLTARSLLRRLIPWSVRRRLYDNSGRAGKLLKRKLEGEEEGIFEQEIWEKFYPQAKGKYVLDVGADPVSVRFFYSKGAKQVWKIGDFYGTHVSPGCIKVDIEGDEKGMVIETHYPNPKLVLLHDYGNGVKLWRLE
jgi:hypothetical protein